MSGKINKRRRFFARLQWQGGRWEEGDKADQKLPSWLCLLAFWGIRFRSAMAPKFESKNWNCFLHMKWLLGMVAQNTLFFPFQVHLVLMKIKRNIQTTNAVIKCSQCNYKTDKSDYVRNRTRGKHPKSKNKCIECNFTNAFPSKIKQHPMWAHWENSWRHEKTRSTRPWRNSVSVWPVLPCVKNKRISGISRQVTTQLFGRILF